MASEDRLYEFEKSLKEIKSDIIGLSEVRRNGESLVRRRNGHYLYYFGETKGCRGTGFYKYINKNIMHNISSIRGVNERISTLKIEVNKGMNISVLQIYAPTLEADEKETLEFYRILEKTLHEEREYYNIVMGNWNAKVGSENDNPQTVGKYGLGERNENGNKMIEFASRNNLKIANTFFSKNQN